MRLVVGVSGASGVIMSLYLLMALKEQQNVEIHMVVSKSAQSNWELETNIPIRKLYELSDYNYENTNMAASISSGSFTTDGMIIIPCSMKTLSAVSTGYAENLIVRAADVSLKENRKVVLVPREMPLGKVHLNNLKTASDIGCIIVPPMLTFYNGPQTLDDQINHVVGKILSQFGMTFKKFVPWNGV